MQHNHFELRQIKPLTVNQQKTFEAYRNDFNLMLHGYAGTVKTFCALYLALEELLSADQTTTRSFLFVQLFHPETEGPTLVLSKIR
jgi:predicted ribonuclease YlaK